MKRTILVLALLIFSFGIFVVIVNRNSNQMTIRQKILKAVYPVFMWMTKKGSGKKEIPAGKEIKPAISFYTLKDTATNGTVFDFSILKGKKVLLVNTASDCGFTGQYEELEELSKKFRDKLVIIGFPANDFKEQEKGTDAEIEQFCKMNYGVSFPLMKKSTVIKNATQNDIFKWLTHADINGWNNKPPAWNFSKYLVNEDGILVNYFAPAISPLSIEIVDQIEKK